MPDYTNSGYLGKNKFYEDGSKKPPYKGTVNVDGKEWELAAWIKTRDDGSKYFSLKISEPYQKQQESAPAQADEDAPF